MKDYNEEISDESEDFVETAMAATTDYLTKIASELFPEKLLRPNYTEADISEDRSKLPDYNGMISGCLLTVNESGTEISCDAKKDVSIGEYQTIAPEEAAKHLKLREDEKPAILYIFRAERQDVYSSCLHQVR